MSNHNFAKLAKILELTTSSHDGEALSAIRKANDFLSKYGKTWSEILHTNQVTNEYIPDPSLRDIFDALRHVILPDKTQIFLDSLESTFNRYCRLSERQTECLMAIYNQWVN